MIGNNRDAALALYSSPFKGEDGRGMVFASTLHGGIFSTPSTPSPPNPPLEGEGFFETTDAACF